MKSDTVSDCEDETDETDESEVPVLSQCCGYFNCIKTISNGT